MCATQKCDVLNWNYKGYVPKVFKTMNSCLYKRKSEKCCLWPPTPNLRRLGWWWKSTSTFMLLQAILNQDVSCFVPSFYLLDIIFCKLDLQQFKKNWDGGQLVMVRKWAMSKNAIHRSCDCIMGYSMPVRLISGTLGCFFPQAVHQQVISCVLQNLQMLAYCILCTATDKIIMFYDHIIQF